MNIFTSSSPLTEVSSSLLRVVGIISFRSFSPGTVLSNGDPFVLR